MAMILEGKTETNSLDMGQTGGFVGPTRVIPWGKDMWKHSGIPHEVILGTAAHCFNAQANPDRVGELTEYLYRTPHAWDVFESMGRAGVINVGLRIHDENHLSGNPSIDALITKAVLLKGGG